MFKIEQGILLNYHEDEPRVCDVLQIPDRYVMSNVRLPSSLGWQTKPLPNSIVLVVSPDAYKSFVICVLRDPEQFLQQGEGVRGATADTGAFLQPGEIQLEAAGDPSAPISGTSGTIYIANDGTVNIHSGKRKEYLTIGGTDDDDDGEVLLVGDNGFFESNVHHITQVRSSYRFDEDNTLEFGNYAVLVTPTVEIETPISTLTMTTLGKTTLQNLTTGIPNTVIELDIDGTLTAKNNFGSLVIDNLGTITLKNAIAKFNAQSSGAITIDGTTINLNNGSFGVARLNDATIVNSLTDPTFMSYLTLLDTFMAAVFTAYNSHTHIYIDTPVGPSVTAIPLPLITATPPTHGSAITGKINAASTTVKAGG